MFLSLEKKVWRKEERGIRLYPCVLTHRQIQKEKGQTLPGEMVKKKQVYWKKRKSSSQYKSKEIQPDQEI